MEKGVTWVNNKKLEEGLSTTLEVEEHPLLHGYILFDAFHSGSNTLLPGLRWMRTGYPNLEGHLRYSLR